MKDESGKMKSDRRLRRGKMERISFGYVSNELKNVPKVNSRDFGCLLTLRDGGFKERPEG
jgi:hypothetical protein